MTIELKEEKETETDKTSEEKFTVRQILQLQEVSISELARRTGYTRMTVLKAINGYPVRPKVIASICSALNVDASSVTGLQECDTYSHLKNRTYHKKQN